MQLPLSWFRCPAVLLEANQNRALQVQAVFREVSVEVYRKQGEGTHDVMSLCLSHGQRLLWYGDCESSEPEGARVGIGVDGRRSGRRR